MSEAVFIVIEGERTLPVCRIDCNRRYLDKDLVLSDGRNRAHFRLDGRVRLDDDRSVGCWNLEAWHVNE